jgi:hypothetical protein
VARFTEEARTPRDSQIFGSRSTLCLGLGGYSQSPLQSPNSFFE